MSAWIAAFQLLYVPASTASRCRPDRAIYMRLDMQGTTSQMLPWASESGTRDCRRLWGQAARCRTMQMQCSTRLLWTIPDGSSSGWPAPTKRLRHRSASSLTSLLSSCRSA